MAILFILNQVAVGAYPSSTISGGEASCELFPFVYTAEILYGSFGKARPGDCYPIAEAAKMDLIVTGPQSYRSRRWCENPSNAFQEIKTLNPRTKIMLYRIGPGQYIISYWGSVGDGWEWLKTNHGRGSSDRWIALGFSTQEYLVALPYLVEQAIEIGNRNWQTYWMERNYADIWSNPSNKMDSRYADGIFADGMQYNVLWEGNWCAESAYNSVSGSCTQKDHPSTYYANGNTIIPFGDSIMGNSLIVLCPTFGNVTSSLA